MTKKKKKASKTAPVSLKKRILIGGGREIGKVAKEIVDEMGFYGGDWNPNNKLKIQRPLMETILRELLRADNPALLFHTLEAWTYAIDQEEGEPSDVTAIAWKGRFSLPRPEDGDSYDVLPWYESSAEAKHDAELLNRTVSRFFGIDHKTRMGMVRKKPKDYAKKLKRLTC